MDRTTALVLVEAVAIGLLGVLVVGLLRSHAEILRQLHRMGADLDPNAPPRSGPRAPAPGPSGGTGASVRTVAGHTPEGDAVSVALDRAGERTLLLFLSSGCTSCGPWWDALRAGEHARVLPGVRVVVVPRDPDEESPALLAGQAPPDVPVVMSSAAWSEFHVPGSPFAVLVDSGTVIGDGVARSWDQLGSLVTQHLADLGGPRLDGAGREQRADEELLAAGIEPGHPSLYRS